MNRLGFVMHKRADAKEYLDMADAESDDVLRSFDFMRFTNIYGGGHRTIRIALEKVLHSWPEKIPVKVLDVGCGAGDTALAIFKWGKDRGLFIQYEGIDKNRRVVEFAKARTEQNGIRYSAGDLFDRKLPQADIVVASMVFHHFGEEEIEKALLNLLAKTRHALIINDLTRSWVLYWLCCLLTRFIKNDVSRYDAPLSVRKGFRVEEMQAYLDRLKIKGEIKKHFCGRFALIIKKHENSRCYRGGIRRD